MVSHLTSLGDDALEPRRCAEVAKLFVDPDRSGLGLGRSLLTTALKFAAHLDRRAVLAVVSTSVRAIRLYQDVGLTEITGFDGRHGHNRVFVSGGSPVLRTAVS